MKIAIIPARGGSKRIPRKNIKSFCGKPMLAWSINAAQKTNLFDKIIISTDDQEIAEVARAHGAEVPFMRPAPLADDFTPTVPVVAHAVSTCQNMGWDIDMACCIYPCAPLIEPHDIAATFNLMLRQKADYAFPIAEYAVPAQWAMRLNDDSRLSFLHPEHELTRSQDLEKLYYDAGQFYWGKAEAWVSEKNILSTGVGYPIPHSRVVDIDTEEDWMKAEYIMNFRQHHPHNK
jgi:pseudaminic acid cytidylyltransferase